MQNKIVEETTGLTYIEVCYLEGLLMHELRPFGKGDPAYEFVAGILEKLQKLTD